MWFICRTKSSHWLHFGFEILKQTNCPWHRSTAFIEYTNTHMHTWKKQPVFYFTRTCTFMGIRDQYAWVIFLINEISEFISIFIYLFITYYANLQSNAPMETRIILTWQCMKYALFINFCPRVLNGKKRYQPPPFLWFPQNYNDSSLVQPKLAVSQSVDWGNGHATPEVNIYCVSLFTRGLCQENGMPSDIDEKLCFMQPCKHLGKFRVKFY